GVRGVRRSTPLLKEAASERDSLLRATGGSGGCDPAPPCSSKVSNDSRSAAVPLDGGDVVGRQPGPGSIDRGGGRAFAGRRPPGLGGRPLPVRPVPGSRPHVVLLPLFASPTRPRGHRGTSQG